MIEIALRCLFSGDHTPDVENSKLKFRLKIALTNVHFKLKIKIVLASRWPSIGRFFDGHISKHLDESDRLYTKRTKLCS